MRRQVEPEPVVARTPGRLSGARWWFPGPWRASIVVTVANYVWQVPHFPALPCVGDDQAARKDVPGWTIVPMSGRRLIPVTRGLPVSPGTALGA